MERLRRTSYAGSMPRRARLRALGLSASLLGCSGQSSFVILPVDAGDPSTRYASACGAWALTVCAYEARCPPYSPWVSQDQCVARSTILCELVASDPNVVFNEQALESCQYPPSCSSSVAYLPLDCLPSGRTPSGGTCVFDEACQSGVCSGVCGTCLPDPCAARCSLGQDCDAGTDASGVLCARAVGESCNAAVDCASFNCEPESDGGAAERVCAPAAQPLEPCGNGCGPLTGIEEGCAGGSPCADVAEYCDATRRCADFDVIGYNQSCGESSTPTTCGGDATCYGVCFPPEMDGDPCDVSQGLDCLDPAVCAGQFCVFPSLAMCAIDAGGP
jgi:hypothetical protein